MEELKPCPACGHTNLEIIEYEENPPASYVRCDCCGLQTGPTNEFSPDVITEWNTLPRRLRWTKEKPTEIGMYWYKDCDNISMTVEVFRERVFFTNGTSADGELLYHMSGYDFDLSVSESTGEWAGPIPEPEE